ncbi:hypothetical protein Q428_12850 [Fervidicella metallireducens AeB]|uniref:histidine kinase n=1 Tax=Fervidicella metallireducens AeB TaxID=1403537 RepID=A0A017RSW0_9CLOT|nr:methyl-accepting chemotaxis protein [Fervidicella metallireducens]EYE87524.1 hypothetical protein Q428_12850 [Fervidicella metallireducens AeB]
MKKGPNLKSIRFKLTTLPLIILFAAFTFVTVVGAYITKVSTINRMKEDGLQLTRQMAKRIEQSGLAYKTLNEQIEDKIRVSGRVILNQPTVNNDVLKKVAKTLDVDEINYTDGTGKIIYSNLESSIGAVFDENHISYPVLSGKQSELMENIRKSRENNNYYKYGYVKNSSGGMIQIGILANKIQSLYDKTSYQAIVDEIGKNPDIVYAEFIDKNLKKIAANDSKLIGKINDDEGSKKAAIDGEEYAKEYFYDVKNVTVYDVLTPVYVNGEHIGAIDIGISMKSVNDSVTKTVITLSIIGIVAFILVGLMLFVFANGSVNRLNKIKEYLGEMSNGNLSINIDEKLLKNKDELGDMSNALNLLKNSFRDIIRDIKEKADEVGKSSESLAATSQEMASGSEEVAATVNEIAKGTNIRLRKLQT